MTEKTISGVHVSPGSAEILVSRGGIINHRLIAYHTLSATSVPKIIKIGRSALKLYCATAVSFFDTVYIRHLICLHVPPALWNFVSERGNSHDMLASPNISAFDFSRTKEMYA